VLVRVRASGLCGSELHGLYQAPRERRRAAATWGHIGGHEPAGEIAALGVGVEGLAVGERVAVYHIEGCGHCKYCRAGWMLHCAVAKRSYGWDADGGHAEYILVKAANCVVLPDALSYADGACCACGTGTAYQGLRRLGVSGRDRLVVYGLGPVGLSAVMLGRAMGATVIGVDPVAERRALATQLGAQTVLDPRETDPVLAVRALTEGEGAEAAMDCSANPLARNQALDCARIWGRVAFIGEGNATTINPSPQMLHKQLTVVGSWVFGLWELRELLDWLARLNLHPEALVTHRFPLEGIAEALALFETGATGKVMITP
jgi:threonine dehydrogenase-like Zn-dependent dehydrogenase